MLTIDAQKHLQSMGGQGAHASLDDVAGGAVVFGSKAETLDRLRSLLRRSCVLELLWFTVKEWNIDRNQLIHEIGQKFGSRPVVVRSSARNEDGAAQSQAGAFAIPR